MRLSKLSLVLFLSFFLSSFCWAKKFKSFKFKDYKNVQLVVEDIDANSVGITRDKVLVATKLRLMRNGLKIVPQTQGRYLYVTIRVMDVKVGGRIQGSAVSFDAGITRLVNIPTGPIMITESLSEAEGMSLLPRGDYESFLEDLNECLDQLILDYLESNL